MNLPLNSLADTTDATEHARYNMIEQQIRPWDVHNLAVLETLAVVRREDFVPPAHYSQAFMDIEIPLTDAPDAMERGLCMLAPKIDARMLNDLEVQPHERALEIGTGSGYMAALLSRHAKDVLSLEINPELAEMARENLESAGITNVTVRLADGASDALAEGPFDVIVLSGSVEVLPQELLNKLADGGRLAAIVGRSPMMRYTIVQRQGQQFTTIQPWDTVAARLEGFATAPRFVF